LDKNALQHQSICVCAFDLNTEQVDLSENVPYLQFTQSFIQICINPYHYNEKEYTVEAILNSKPGFYFIKWKEYDLPDDCTWEPIEKCDHCPDIVMEFKGNFSKNSELGSSSFD
jgi:hypothetical protein